MKKMTKITTDNFKGMNIKEVKKVFKKERGITASEFRKVNDVTERNGYEEKITYYVVAISEMIDEMIEKAFILVDNHGNVTSVERYWI